MRKVGAFFMIGASIANPDAKATNGVRSAGVEADRTVVFEGLQAREPSEDPALCEWHRALQGLCQTDRLEVSTTLRRVNQKLISQIGKSQRLTILNELKRTKGLSVKELAKRLKMSYMGVKQHCLDLEKEHYLDTWRRSKGVGRPEMLYRLTMRAHELFPQTSNAMTIDLLQASQTLYGPAAAEKLLFLVFQKQTEQYLSKLKGDSLSERAKSLARLRDLDGYMSNYREEGEEASIVEYHTPILDLLRTFPIVERLETELFHKVLKTKVLREEQSTGGLYECTFRLG